MAEQSSLSALMEKVDKTAKVLAIRADVGSKPIRTLSATISRTASLRKTLIGFIRKGSKAGVASTSAGISFIGLENSFGSCCVRKQKLEVCLIKGKEVCCTGEVSVRISLGKVLASKHIEGS